MAFSEEDKIVIKFLRKNKHYGAKQLIKNFLDRGWTLVGLKKLLRKIDLTGSSERCAGSGRPRTARKNENIEQVQELVLSQEDKPKSHLTIREIAREVGISKTSVHKIVKQDLALKCFKKRQATYLTEANKQARRERSKELLDRYAAQIVNFIWFTDKKLFTIATPKNSQKDISGNRLLHTRSTFSPSVMVSVGVSALGKTDIHLIEPGVKISGAYYRDYLLSEKLLPDIREYSDYFTFQQDGANAHRARETVELLKKETPDFIPPNLLPPNSPDLNPVDYKICKIKFTGQRSETLKNCVSESFMPGRSLISWSSMLPLANGVGLHAFKLVLKQKADILNTNCSAILIKCRLRTK